MELDDVEGVEGKLKIWIRRVWTLEMVSIFLTSERVMSRAANHCTRVSLVSAKPAVSSFLAVKFCQIPPVSFVNVI